jgi:hypothetical protein
VRATSYLSRNQIEYFYVKKSQTQSRTPGSVSSNSNNRRKTRVMSDDEDITMDETNQVYIPLVFF